MTSNNTVLKTESTSMTWQKSGCYFKGINFTVAISQVFLRRCLTLGEISEYQWKKVAFWLVNTQCTAFDLLDLRSPRNYHNDLTSWCVISDPFFKIQYDTYFLGGVFHLHLRTTWKRKFVKGAVSRKLSKFKRRELPQNWKTLKITAKNITRR